MAKKLIDGMTTDWDPEKYKDEYRTQVMAMIEEKVKHPEAEIRRAQGTQAALQRDRPDERAAAKPVAGEARESETG